MTQWIDMLREKRGELVSRSASLAAAGRDRGVEVLGRVRTGTLDWHATLEARRSELREAPRGFGLTGLQLLVVERLDGVLLALGQRVRAEMERLAQLELGAPAREPATVEQATARRTPVEARAEARADEAPRKAATKKTPRAKRVRRGRKSLVLPIAGYEELTAKQILKELPGLTDAQRVTVRAHEEATKNRKTVLRALD